MTQTFMFALQRMHESFARACKQHTPKPKLTQLEMVHVLLSDGQWWPPITLRQAIRDRYGVHVEAVTSRIRELRRKCGLTITCEKVKDRPEYRYRLKEGK